MATKNLRKIRSWGLTGLGFTGDFDPDKYLVNWPKFQKYIDKKEKSVIFNHLFRPLFMSLYMELLGEGCVKSEAKRRARKKAIEIVKAQLTPTTNSTQQSFKGQEEILPEAT